MYKITVNSFLSKEISLLKEVKYSEILNIVNLPTYDEFVQLYKQDVAISENRINAMWVAFMKKARMLETFQRTGRIY